MNDINLSKLKIAIVHEWLTNPGGSENVVWTIHEMFPESPIYTSVFNKSKMSKFLEAEIRTSFLQKIPFAKQKHQYFLNFMPHAFESFDFKGFDIVITSNHSCSKGIITNLETMHVCYCNTPMRYVWDESHEYVKNSNFPSILKKWYIPRSLHKIRIWDRLAADRVDYFIANSGYISKRIEKYYKRESSVIYPPVSTSKFNISNNIENYFLAVGRLIPYKKFDLIVETFNKLQLPLKIIGTGPEYKNLKRLAKENIEFIGFIPNDDLPDLYNKCQALIFPQVEDFGIVPIETMASGRPVIAYKSGGARETVVEGKTGLFFEEQSIDSLSTAINKFQKMSFQPNLIREHSLKFDEKEFKVQLESFIKQKYVGWQRFLSTY